MNTHRLRSVFSSPIRLVFLSSLGISCRDALLLKIPLSMPNHETVSSWISTYRIITAQRLLARYKVVLDDDILIQTLGVKGSFYHRLLSVPFAHVFNGVLLEQVHDYQVYLQKMFLDYLLSGESDKVPEAPGQEAREELEIKRLRLLDMNQEMESFMEERNELIAQSQSLLISFISDFEKHLMALVAEVTQALNRNQIPIEKDKTKNIFLFLLAVHRFQTPLSENTSFFQDIEKRFDLPPHASISQTFSNALKKLEPLLSQVESLLKDPLEKAHEMGKVLETRREEVYALILEVKELLTSLPEYKPNFKQIRENLSELSFNSSLTVEK